MSWNFDEIVTREDTSSVKYDLRNEIFGSGDIIPMWVADMDFRTPDFVVRALRERIDHEILGYSFRSPEYYKSITDWILQRHNWKVCPEWICFSPGIVPALNLCTLSFTEPGDGIIVQPPVYFPFFSAIEAHGRKLLMNRLVEKGNKWLMDTEALTDKYFEGAKAIMISNPHNPVGRCWTHEELLSLCNYCVEKRIIIISDEIHGDLTLPGYKHTPVASLSDDIASITITLTAPSKTFNIAGLSTSSVIISNEALRNKYLKITENLHIGNGNIFGIAASVAAYTHGHEWLSEMIKYVNENISFAADYIQKNIPEITTVKTEATYMMWLDCRKLKLQGRELHEFFVKRAHVGMNEGSTFGPGGDGFMRMNVATPRIIVKQALEQIREAVSTLKIHY